MHKNAVKQTSVGSSLNNKLSKHFTSSILEKAFHNINHGCLIVDKTGHIIFANKAFFSLLQLNGHTYTRLAQKKFTDFYTTESQFVFSEQVLPLLNRKQVWLGEINLINRNKKIIRTSCEFVPLLSPKEKSLHYVCWINQIAHNQTMLCQSLDETIDFFQSLFEMAPHPIYIINYEGKIRIANKSLVDITGYSKDELCKKTFMDLEETISSKNDFIKLLKKIKRKGFILIQGRHRRKDNTYCPVEINLKKVMLCGKPEILIYIHNISLRSMYKEEAKRNLELRNLITKVTNHFSLVRIDSFDKAANSALGDLGRYAKVDRCYLFKVEDDRQFISNTHEWCSKYAKPEIKNLQHIPLEPFKWLLTHIEQHNYFAVDSVEDLPNALKQAKDEFMREKIKSMLVVPLRRGKTTFGSVGFDAVAHHVKWDPIIIQLLTNFSNFIAQALDRKETLVLQEEKKNLEFLLAKKMLNSRKKELAFFIKNAPVAIAIFDKDMRYIATSDRWLIDFHINKKNISGQLFGDLFRLDLTKWKKIHQRCLQGETLENDKAKFICPNKKSEWIKWKTYPRIDQDNKICGMIMVVEFITEQVKHQEQISHMGNHDGLTDLPNRKYFREILSNILSNHKNNNYTLLILAVNNLESINNYYNIFVGDIFIQKLSKRLKIAKGKNGFLARLDGGQFAIIVPYSQKTKVRTLINKINNAVAEPFDIQNYHISTGLNIGVRSFCVDCEQNKLGLKKAEVSFNYMKLFKDAEIALQSAKIRPMEQVVYFDPVLEEKHLRALLLENDLQQAIDSSQFYMLYQPYFSLVTGKIIGTEALIRWRHPKLHLISPAEFIPLAEKTGKIVVLGYWIINKVFEDISKLLKKIKKSNQLIFSINLSPDQLRDKQFVKELAKLIVAHKIPAQILHFEITETSLLPGIVDEIQVLKDIESLGCHISIDDFGTGNSTFERLRDLPISTLKIDKSFVDEIETSSKSTSLIKHMILLAKELGIRIIAEGVENEEQSRILQLLGCDIAQGFLYSKPIQLQKLEEKFLGKKFE